MKNELCAKRNGFTSKIFSKDQISKSNCQQKVKNSKNLISSSKLWWERPTNLKMLSKHFSFIRIFLNNSKQTTNCLMISRKSLKTILKNKRREFLMFYFLSNDELLEILANSQNLDVIQQHLKTCFDNIYRLEIEEDLQAIKSMFSGEGEKVPFSGKKH